MLNYRKSPGIVLAPLLFFVCSLPVAGTVIVQKNGDVISGKILEEKADKYIFQSPYGKLQVAKNSISKLILDEKTIELKEVDFKDKKVRARLVSEENNTAVYLTEDGQTIRKEKISAAAGTSGVSAIAAAKDERHRFLIAASGSYGFSTFQQVATDVPGTSGMPPLSQSLHANTFGTQISGHFAWFAYAGVGAGVSYFRWSGTVSLIPQGQQIAYDSTTTNNSIMVAPSLIFSVFGNLGSKNYVHDLRLELQLGQSFNSATMDLLFRNPPQGFPQAARAAGKNSSGAVQVQAYYSYSLSSSLRLRLGFGYWRAFYTNIYEGGLQASSPVPQGDKFFQDFNGNLARGGEMPQIISATLGAEFGF